MSFFSRVFSICTLSLLSCLTPANAQIPVTDAVQIGTHMTNQVSNITQYVAQYNAMVAQYNQALYMQKTISGIRNFDQLLNNPYMRQFVPIPYQTAFTQASQLRQCSQKISEMAKRGCHVSAHQDTMRNVNNQIEGQINTRRGEIQSLINKLQTTSEPKDVADLQARIAGEQAALANEQASLTLMQQQQAAQQAANNQAYSESFVKKQNITIPTYTPNASVSMPKGW
jgi:type IV secretion system protein VirB5